jgi:hypothetical protein
MTESEKYIQKCKEHILFCKQSVVFLLLVAILSLIMIYNFSYHFCLMPSNNIFVCIVLATSVFSFGFCCFVAGECNMNAACHSYVIKNHENTDQIEQKKA